MFFKVAVCLFCAFPFHLSLNLLFDSSPKDVTEFALSTRRNLLVALGRKPKEFARSTRPQAEEFARGTRPQAQGICLWHSAAIGGICSWHSAASARNLFVALGRKRKRRDTVHPCIRAPARSNAHPTVHSYVRALMQKALT